MGSSVTSSQRAAAAERTRRLEALRRRGARGGVILKHRAMRGLDWTWHHTVRVVLLPVTTTAALLWGLPGVMRGWEWLFQHLADGLGLPGAIAIRHVNAAGLYRLDIPYLVLESPWPTTGHWWGVGIATALVFAASFALRDGYTPLRYFFRSMVFIQLTAFAYCALAAPPFPYPVPGYMAGLLTAGLLVVMLVPWVLALTFYVWRHALWRELLLTGMILGYLLVLLPLQAATHAWLIQRGSVLVMPVLFLVFGLLLEVMAFVAFYGWGMSWPTVDEPGSQA